MPDEPLVFAFHDDRLYTFERAPRYSPSVFGGPLNTKISGQPFGPKPLHLVASLCGWHIPALSENYLIELPLIYGLHYSGCQLDYRLAFTHQVELLVAGQCDRPQCGREVRCLHQHQPGAVDEETRRSADQDQSYAAEPQTDEQSLGSLDKLVLPTRLRSRRTDDDIVAGTEPGDVVRVGRIAFAEVQSGRRG